MIPLVSAERCWSQAMELKAQLEKESISNKRQHMVSNTSLCHPLLLYACCIWCSRLEPVLP